MIEVEIIWFTTYGDNTEKAKDKIAAMLYQGWVIAGAGGGGSDEGYSSGFVILQRGEAERSEN